MCLMERSGSRARLEIGGMSISCRSFPRVFEWRLIRRGASAYGCIDFGYGRYGIAGLRV
jgi:hypothetical protein